MNMNDTIQPRDEKETSILTTAGKIAGALTVLGSMVAGLLASTKGVEWFTDNLPALISGLTVLISGGVATGIAVRRMKIDKAAKALSILLCMAIAIVLQGCVGTMVEIPINITPPSIPSGEPKFVVVTVKRLAFCNAVAMPKISYVPSTGEINMEGYTSDGGATTVGIAAEAAAKGAIMGMKGTSGL
jgi:hypothetical protein